MLFGRGICFLMAASIVWVAVWPPPEHDPPGHPPGGSGGAVTEVTQETIP